MISFKRYNRTFIDVAFAIGGGLFLGIASFLLSPLWVLAGLVATFFLVFTLSKPQFILLVILVVTSSIVYEDKLPLLPIGIGSLHLTDFLLLAALVLILVRGLTEPGFRLVRTPLNLPLLIFYGVALFSTLTALLYGSVTRQLALRDTRVITYYLTFFLVINLIRNKFQLSSLIRWLIGLGTVVAVAMAAQYLLGESIQLLPGRVETLGTQGTTYSGITRILPPGQSLVFLVFIILVILTITENQYSKSAVRFFLAGILGLAVILTFNRNFWAGTFIALAPLPFLMRNHDRNRLVIWALIAILLIISTSLIVQSWSPSLGRGLVNGFVARLETLVNQKTMSEESLNDRSLENEYAISQIIQHPIIGMGLGSFYRPWDNRLDWENFDGRGYIHNGHLGIILKTGFLGYACFLGLSIVFIWRGLRYWEKIPIDEFRAVYLANVLAYIGIFVAAIVNPVFLQWFWTPVFGIMMGTNELILHFGQGINEDPKD